MGWWAGVHLGPARPLQDLPPFLSGLARLKAQSAGLTDRPRRSFSRRVYFFWRKYSSPLSRFSISHSKEHKLFEVHCSHCHKIISKVPVCRAVFCLAYFFADAQAVCRRQTGCPQGGSAERRCVLSELKPKKPPLPPPYGFDAWRNKRKEATHESS
jgi:hypothetical protein